MAAFRAFFLLFVPLVVSCACQQADEDNDLTHLKLSTGWIRGRKVDTKRGVEGFAFTAVPYAEPPVGERRFRKAERKSPWNGTIDATKYGNSCMWNSSITQLIEEYTIMSEDCLQANVFTNRHCLTRGNCSVMLYLHGGGFIFDSPMLLKEEFIITNFGASDRNVVVVTVAYRLGVLGFGNFSPRLKGTSAPKNIGLHDMLEALRWIQREIDAFGGDKTRVTAMGHSSGSIAIDQLTQTSASEGLIHQAIIMSGSARTQLLAVNQNTNTSQSIAVALNCATWETNFDDLTQVENAISCLRNIPAETIVAQQRVFEDQGILLFGSARDDELLPASIDTLAKTKRPIPIMVGTVTWELQETSYLLRSDGTVDEEFLLWYCNKTVHQFNYRNKSQAVEDCFEEYNNVDRATFLYDDYTFFLPSFQNVDDTEKVGGNGFLYEFTYPYVRDVYDLGPKIPKFTVSQLPRHTYELVYILGIHEGKFTEKDEIIRQKFSQLFVNFINSGDPSTEADRWERFNGSRANFFRVDFDENNEMPGMMDGYHTREIDFWTKTMEIDGNGRDDVLDEADVFVPDVYIKHGKIPEEAKANFPAFPTATVTPLSDGGADWSLWFKLAATVNVILAFSLLVTCGLWCHNMRKRRSYAEIA